MSLLYRLVEPGANLYPLEVIPLYGLAAWFACLQGEWGAALGEVAWQNALCQICLFVVVVQLPTLLTGHMSYVDIGWPCGLCVLAYNALSASSGDATRARLVGGVLLLHGGRMAVGALVMFFPYVWKKDLSRYQFAKARWNEHTGAPGTCCPRIAVRILLLPACCCPHVVARMLLPACCSPHSFRAGGFQNGNYVVVRALSESSWKL